MATTTSSEPKSAEARTLAEGGSCVAMHDVGWKGYLTILKLRGERHSPRIVYLDGTVWLMTTIYPHEHIAERLGIFVTEVVVGLDIPCTPSGSTTFRRKAKRGGVEPDKSFYLASEPRIRGKAKENLHLRRDPPPDLAVEAVQTHASDAAIEVYRRFGVPEVWVCDGPEFHVLVLRKNHRYTPSETSLAFPFLKAAEIQDWITRPQTGPETDWIKELRRWVRDVLVPRVHPTGGGA